MPHTSWNPRSCTTRICIPRDRALDSAPVSGTLRSGLGLAALVLIALAIPASLAAGPDVSSIENPILANQADLSGMQVGDRVKLTLNPDRELEGEITGITQFAVKVKTRFGVQEIRKSEIVAWEKIRTFQEKYDERAAACKTPDDWCDLGDWAEEEKHERHAIESYEKAVELDTDHARARDALGHEKVDGEWYPFDEAQEKKGLEFCDGEWRTPEECRELEEKAKESATAEKLKGREALQKEYEGRPWAEIDPIETKHYIIWCNSTEEMADYYSDVMEALYKEFDKVFPEKHFPRNSRRKSTVYIHANHQQFMDWTFNGPGTGGFYRPALRDVTAYHGSFGTTGSTEEVLAHEGTHQFQGLIFDNLFALPAWFIEGLAVYFGDGSKISRRRVDINEIPRDRLIGLQEAIRNGTYVDLRRLTMIPQPRFGGFVYSHGWGIIYWCLWGEKMGAKNKGIGREIMNDWLIHCKRESKKEGMCDLRTNSDIFINLLQTHTRKTLEEWEEEYKEWILSLPVEEIGKKRGNKWTSEALKLTIEKPSGWRWEKEVDLASDEVVAAKGSGDKARRVSTYCWGNWQHASMSETYAETLAQNIFEGIPGDTEYRLETVGGFPGAVRARFTAQRLLKVEVVLDQQGVPRTEKELGPPLEYEVVFYGGIDKIYCNVFECDAEIWEDNYSDFQKFLEKFHIDN